jgi:hypothetical protein
MSANTLLNLPTNAIIQTGTFGETTGNIVFSQPFPSGATPYVFLQNSQGATGDQVVLTVGAITANGFAYIKFDTVSQTNITNAIATNYLAIWIPAFQ